MADLLTAAEKVIRREGGYVHDPDDAGGRTKYGISQRAYPDLDIANLTKAETIDIYEADYWTPIQGNKIKDQRLAEILLDFAVNAGVNRAVRTLQATLDVQIDGDLGPVTLGALNAGDPEKVALHFTLRRIGFYAGLAIKRKAQQKFLAGWVARALDALYVKT